MSANTSHVTFSGEDSYTEKREMNYLGINDNFMMLLKALERSQIYHHGKQFCPIIVRMEPIGNAISIRGNARYSDLRNRKGSSM